MPATNSLDPLTSSLYPLTQLGQKPGDQPPVLHMRQCLVLILHLLPLVLSNIVPVVVQLPRPARHHSHMVTWGTPLHVMNHHLLYQMWADYVLAPLAIAPCACVLEYE